MEVYLKSLIICAMISIINGFYISEKDNNLKNIKNSEIKDYSKILESWANLKWKLHKKFNKDIEFDQSSNQFNEMEVIKMIPLIIDQYRNKKLTKNDETVLSEIYGNLWSIICEEAERSRNNNNEKNPLLDALLQSFYLTDDQNNNDIDRNTVFEKKKLQKISKKVANKLLLNVNKSDHPSQRVLNTAAMLIHQVMNTRNINRKSNNLGESVKLGKLRNNRVQRRATFNLQLKNIPITDITRSKRNLKYHLSNLNSKDLSSEKIDAILKIYKEQNGILDYDDEEDDDDYDLKEDINQKHLSLMSSDARDDLYDDLYEDDQEIMSHHDSDSFQDLILLAAKNRAREEEEENRLKHIKNRQHFLSTN